MTPARRPIGQLNQARTLVAAGHRVGEVAVTLGVGRSTLYRALAETVEVAPVAVAAAG